MTSHSTSFTEYLTPTYNIVVLLFHSHLTLKTSQVDTFSCDVLLWAGSGLLLGHPVRFCRL